MKLKDVKYTTSLNKLYRYQKDKIVYLACEWCMDTFGVKKWCPSFLVDIVNDKLAVAAGWYETSRHDPEIIINLADNETVGDIIDTVIHEYTHYLQPNFKEVYFGKDYDPDNHPYEIEARAKAKKYRKKCFDIIMCR